MPSSRSARIGYDWTTPLDLVLDEGPDWAPADLVGTRTYPFGVGGASIVHQANSFDGASAPFADSSPIFGGCPCPGCALTEKILKAELLSSSSPSGDGALFLGDDIPDDTSSTTSIAVGGTLSSAVQSAGDLDYIRVSLVAGQAYTFSLVGMTDAYLELRDASGVLVAENDDGGILLNSFLMHRASQTGNYFIVARGYDSSVTGNYTLAANAISTGNTSPTTFPGNSLPQFSWDEAAIQISRSGASWSNSFGAPATISYAFRSSAPATMPDDTGGFTRFSAVQIAAAEAALAAWASVANITFVRINDGDGYSNNASILFGNYSSGAAGAAAFAYLPSSGSTAAGTAATSVQGDVWINSTLSYNINPVVGEYGQQVLIHEIGHALGLSHPADYNADPNVTIEYGTHAVYFNDSRMFTDMSYFASSNTGATLPAFGSLPQLHDIAAIQRLYGANMASRGGDTVYGFNSNTGVAQYTLTLATQGAVFAIWDGGGLDTLDLSGYSTNSTIDLRQEAFSSAGPGTSGGGGLAIFNVSIARGAIIENAIGGSGADTLIGNNADNRLTGNAGADTINGGEGIDTALFNLASAGVSFMRSQNASWTVNAGAEGTDTLTNIELLRFTDRTLALRPAEGTLDGNGTSDILLRSVSGQLAAWTMNGASVTGAAIIGVQDSVFSVALQGDFDGDGDFDMVVRAPGSLAQVWLLDATGVAGVATYAPNAADTMVGTGDFNGDGRDDVLFRSDTGLLSQWQMHGLGLTVSAFATSDMSWALAAIADFNADGRDDFLWRHSSGALAQWSLNGFTATNLGVFALSDPNWSIVGTGDFNGDLREDILWRHSSGLLAEWLMDGTGVLSAGVLAASDAAWSVSDIGDYDGDGRDDILWQGPDGTFALWVLNGLSVTSTSIVGNPGAGWDDVI